MSFFIDVQSIWVYQHQRNFITVPYRMYVLWSRVSCFSMSEIIILDSSSFHSIELSWSQENIFEALKLVCSPHVRIFVKMYQHDGCRAKFRHNIFYSFFKISKTCIPNPFKWHSCDEWDIPNDNCKSFHMISHLE